MLRPNLTAKILSAVGLVISLALLPLASHASDNTPSGSISGRVIDATTKKPIPGTVIVALERQPGDGTIVNATSPDATGKFSFSQVPAGNYALVVTGQDSGKTAYVPVLVVGKGVAPGANLGTIALKSSGGNVHEVQVPVQSDKPITVTLAMTQTVGEHSFALPWVDGIPTFDTKAGTNCSNGACASYSIPLPSSKVLMANFDGSAIQYLPNPLPATYTVSATAYTQNGAKPNCESHTSAPVQLNPQSKTAPQPIVFKGCD